MLQNIKNLWNPHRAKELTDIRNIGLYIFALIVLAISWSGFKTLQNNYELQKQISVLKQQNAVINLGNENTSLQNQYYLTDEYLELSARQNFGLAAPGEKVLLVPNSVSMKYIDQSLVVADTTRDSGIAKSKYSKNLADWRNFLLGRKLFDN